MDINENFHEEDFEYALVVGKTLDNRFVYTFIGDNLPGGLEAIGISSLAQKVMQKIIDKTFMKSNIQLLQNKEPVLDLINNSAPSSNLADLFMVEDFTDDI